MEVALLMKAVGIGLIVSVSVMLLGKSGRDEQATFVAIAGIIVALMLLIDQIRALFDAVMTLFGM